MLVPLEKPNFSVRFAEDMVSPEELEMIMRKLKGDIKQAIDKNIRAWFNEAKRKGVPSGYNNASDYLTDAGWDVIEAAYTEAVRKGLIKDSVYNQRSRDKIGWKYSQFIGQKTMPLYRQLQ